MTQLTPQEIAAADQIIDIAPEATDLISLGWIASAIEKQLSPHVITMALILAANRIKENQSHPWPGKTASDPRRRPKKRHPTPN